MKEMKGMTVLIVTGLIIVFVAMFFTLFILDRIFATSTSCRFDIVSEKNICSITEGSAAFAGMLFSGLFVLISLVVAYVLLSTVTSKRSICFGSSVQNGFVQKAIRSPLFIAGVSTPLIERAGFVQLPNKPVQNRRFSP